MLGLLLMALTKRQWLQNWNGNGSGFALSLALPFGPIQSAQYPPFIFSKPLKPIFFITS